MFLQQEQRQAERDQIAAFLAKERRPRRPHSGDARLDLLIQALDCMPGMVAALVRRMRLTRLRREFPDPHERYSVAIQEVRPDPKEQTHYRLITRATSLKRAVFELLL